MQFVRSHGKWIGYVTGQGGILGTRKTLVFVHGSGGSHVLWNYQRKFFENAYNVVMVDLPGHGEAGGDGEKSVEAYADHLLSSVLSLPGGMFCLFGHSLGGAIAQIFALSHSNQLHALVLVGTGARLRVLPEIFTGIHEKFSDTVALINRYAFSSKSPSDLVQSGVTAMLQTRTEILIDDLTACNEFDVMDRIEEIQIPTLVLNGRDDRLTPPKYAQFLADRIENARLEIIDEAGHMVMIEQPEEFNRRTLSFLKSLDGRRENDFEKERQPDRGDYRRRSLSGKRSR